MSAAAPATTAPSVKDLTWDQRHALLTQIVKAWYEEVGPDVPLIVQDGDRTLGVLTSGTFPPRQSTIPHLTPEQMKELERRIADTSEDDLITTEQAREYFEKVLADRPPRS